MYETADIRKNLKVVIDGAPYVVIDFQHVKPGKGNAFTRTRLKNMITGAVLDRTYKTGERLDPAALEEHDMQFLYKEGDRFHFMNNATYEQVELDEDHVGDAAQLDHREPLGQDPLLPRAADRRDPAELRRAGGDRVRPGPQGRHRDRRHQAREARPPARRSWCRCSSSRATGSRSTPAPENTSAASRVRQGSSARPFSAPAALLRSRSLVRRAPARLRARSSLPCRDGK